MSSVRAFFIEQFSVQTSDNEQSGFLLAVEIYHHPRDISIVSQKETLEDVELMLGARGASPPVCTARPAVGSVLHLPVCEI